MTHRKLVNKIDMKNSQSAIQNPQSIELHIEELVLHGFAPGDRYRIGEAVERELTRLFAERGVPTSLTNGGEIVHQDGGEFNAPPGPKPEVIGIQVAQSVYRGVSK